MVGLERAMSDLTDLPEEHEERKPKKRVKIRIGDLISALEGMAPDNAPQFLDTDTGEIVVLWEDAPDYDELSEAIDADDAGRYRRLDKLESHRSFEVMERFASSLPESSERRRLLDALSRDKPFRRFREAMRTEPSLRDPWFAFRDEAYGEIARKWIADEGIEPEWIDVRGPLK
jgi:hypothetical protein